MKVRISARAQSDLDRIFAYVYVRQSAKAADRFLELAQEATEFLVQHPLAGPRPRWQPGTEDCGLGNQQSEFSDLLFRR